MKLNSIKRIYFIGISGIGVSALARMCISKKIKVLGSDLNKNEISRSLENNGAKIFYEHSKNNIDESIDLIVKTSAVRSNEETKRAKELNIPIISRGKFLSLIANDYFLLAVAGSHGKTTTSSLLTLALKNIYNDVSFNIGGVLLNYNSNSFLSDSKYFVTESDESDGSFLYLKPNIAIINNLDPEHLDYYGDFSKLKSAFIDFSKNSKITIYNGDDKNLKCILKSGISFGFSKSNDYYAYNICMSDLVTSFDVYKNNVKLNKRFSIPLFGKHNILNSLACIVALDQLKFSINDINFMNFLGTKRRFELIHYNKDKDISLYDDYAHHPKEIHALFDSILNNNKNNKRTIILYQPHRYTRTRDSFHEIIEVLKVVPYLIILKEYAANEKIIEGAGAFDIYSKLNGENHKILYFADSIENAKNFIKSILEHGDRVCSVGAGNLNQVLYGLKKEL